MVDLAPHAVGPQLPSLHYIPDFLSPLEEEQLLKEIHASRARWNVVSGRRVQVHGGTVHARGLLKAPMARWMEALAQRISDATGVFGGQPANHVLVNSYGPGDGIMPHEDGPLYHPAVVILSLGGPAILRFWRKANGEGELLLRGPESPPGPCCSAAVHRCMASVVCQPRSLLVFQDQAYSDCLHGIEFTAEEVVDASCVNAQQCGLRPGDVVPRAAERTSLTVRRVLRTSGVSIRL